MAAAFPEPGPLTEELRLKDIPVHHIGRVRSVCLAGPLLQLVRLVRSCDAQVLHTHDEVVNLLGRACRFFRPSLSVVSSVHVMRSRYGGQHLTESDFAATRRKLRYALYRQIDNQSSRLANAVIAHSEAIADDLKSGGIDESRIAVLRHGLPVEWLTGPLPDRGTLRRLLPKHLQIGPLIGIVGAIEPGKGQMLLIEAAPLLLARSPVGIVLLGEPRDWKYHEALISRANVLGVTNRIWFAGHVADMWPAYADLDIVVQTSYSEGLPLAMMEAMASGRPIVATNAGGTSELITHDTTGLLIRPGDRSALANSLIALLASRESRLRLGDAAKAHARSSFRLAPVVDRLEAIYASALR